MPARFDESEYVFCDLQAVYRYLRASDETVAVRFLEAAYDAFEFIAENPLIGRAQPEFDHADLRSWRVTGFRSYIIFYRPMADRVQIWRVLHGARDLTQIVK